MVGESGLATGVVPVRLRARRWFALGFFRFELGYRCRCASVREGDLGMAGRPDARTGHRRRPGDLYCTLVAATA